MVLDQGITKADDGLSSASWNVAGHTYTPKLHSENTFIWYTFIPAGTFVLPHVHPTQDEWITMLEGIMEIEFDGDFYQAGPGDTVRMPMGVVHGIFNCSGSAASCVFGVAPLRKLFDLFCVLDGVTDPEELVRLSALHEVDFLPPPAE